MPQGARGLGFLCCGGGTSRPKEGVSSFQEKLEESDAGRTLLAALLCDLSIQAPGGAECPSTIRPSARPPSTRPPSTVHPSTVPSSVAVPSPPSGPRASAQLCSPLGRPGTAPVSPDPVSPDPGAAPAGRFCSCCRQAQDTPASLWFQPCPPVPGLRDRHTQVHTPPSHTRTRIHVPLLHSSKRVRFGESTKRGTNARGQIMTRQKTHPAPIPCLLHQVPVP